jgi:predicted nicotinamide N-methyase
MLWTTNDLDFLEEQVQSPRDIALLRHKLLEDNGIGFAAKFVPLLQQVVDAWLDSLQKKASCVVEEKKEELVGTSTFSVYKTIETNTLSRVLTVHVACAQKDPILSEELGLQGSHVILSKLIRCDSTTWRDEEDRDAIMELQDLACEIASSSSSFPLRVAPVVNLQERLPLCISFSDNTNTNAHKVFIQQVTSRQSAQEDVGFVLWPSAVALSQWLIENPTVLQNCKSILELGAGCGLVGLLASQLLQQEELKHDDDVTTMILTDFNPVVLDNLQLNIELNGVNNTTAKKLDFYEQTGDRDYWVDSDSIEQRQDQVDLILAADMICQPSDAVAAANSIHDALKKGGRAIVVCADGKHRFGVDCFLDECRRVGGLVVETSSVTANTESMHLAAGYVEGMSLTMFTIEKV